MEGRAGEWGVERGGGEAEVGGRSAVEGEQGLGESWLHCCGV